MKEISIYREDVVVIEYDDDDDEERKKYAVEFFKPRGCGRRSRIRGPCQPVRGDE